jgi:NAD(P)-dependent dehydrogenase (short-subunit alcohol dehydrogenase family)
MNRFQDKNVLVTGGSSGIGLAAAVAFAAEGAHLIVTGRDPAALADARERLGDSARTVISDASRLADIDALVADITATEGHLDSVFVNAGSAALAPFGGIAEASLDDMVDVHVKGPYFLLQQLAPLLAPGSTVVLNGSVAALRGMPGMSAYAVGKAGLVSLAGSLAAELLPRGIRVNAVSPGAVATPAMIRTPMPEEARAAMLAQIPLGRPASPEEIASVVLFLSSPESAYVVGHNLIADGGMTAV